MIINVTAADIKKSERVNCYKCPIAKAIKRITAIPAYIKYDEIVWNGKIYPTSSKDAVLYALSLYQSLKDLYSPLHSNNLGFIIVNMIYTYFLSKN